MVENWRDMKHVGLEILFAVSVFLLIVGGIGLAFYTSIKEKDGLRKKSRLKESLVQCVTRFITTKEITALIVWLSDTKRT